MPLPTVAKNFLHIEGERPIPLGTQEWHDWLNHKDNKAFRYKSDSNTLYPVYRRGPRGNHHWIMQCFRKGVKHRHTIGKKEMITEARLASFASLIDSAPHPTPEPKAPEPPISSSNTAANNKPQKRFHEWVLWTYLGGIALLLGTIATILQAYLAASPPDNPMQSTAYALQSTQVTLMQKQLDAEQQIQTLVASGAISGPTATAAAQRIAELQMTVTAAVIAQQELKNQLGALSSTATTLAMRETDGPPNVAGAQTSPPNQSATNSTGVVPQPTQAQTAPAFPIIVTPSPTEDVLLPLQPSDPPPVQPTVTETSDKTPMSRTTDTPGSATNTPGSATNTPGSATDTPQPKPTDTPQPKPTDTPQPKPTDTPRPKPTDTPRPKPTDTPRPKPSATEVSQATPTPCHDNRDGCKKSTSTKTPEATPCHDNHDGCKKNGVVTTLNINGGGKGKNNSTGGKTSTLFVGLFGLLSILLIVLLGRRLRHTVAS